ncbi:unnamed protein product [Notodromas monacha]|uniref:Innexin n=1 Tax=Notodromas monacha TaxID=399045 RepID=A0A7R9BV39_9CRUS|nr:unnamed protein product [Notodromas monacha]CAG0921189.1 unnamed protein product [Notodromas monacha]
MLEVFSGILHLLKFRKARADSVIFRLHYTFTVCLLVGASVLISSSQYVGKPIHCAYNKNLFPEAYVESFCWVNSTYYHPHDVQPDPLQAAPHVRPGADNVVHVKYYQWVAMVLLFQAILFYIPRWLWKGFEGGLLERLLITSDARNERSSVTRISSYLCQNSSKNDWYMYRYFACELVALLNILAQLFLLDWFFGGLFMDYGVRVLEFLESEGNHVPNPMWRVFPRVTKCTLQAFAFNGNLDVIEALCVLPLNVVNEKIFLVQWFWFLLLGGMTLILVFYRLMIFLSPRLHQSMFRNQLKFVDKKLLDRIFLKTSRGDWFLLYTMSYYMDFGKLADVLYDMDRRMRIGEEAAVHHFINHPTPIPSEYRSPTPDPNNKA